MQNEQKVINIFLAAAMLSKSLAENLATPIEVNMASMAFDDLLGHLQWGDMQSLGWEDVEKLVNSAMRFANEFSSRMAGSMTIKDHPYVFHQSLVLALMDLDRALIKVPTGTSPDDLSEAMLDNRKKLKKIYDLLDEDPTLLDSIE